MNIHLKSLARWAGVVLLLWLQPALTCQLRAQTWATNSPLNVARWSHTATLLTNGLVLIAGGTIHNSAGIWANTNACELYDPSAGASLLTGAMQDYRDGHTATRLANGQVLVAGAGNDATSEVYDPASGTWMNLAPMGDERSVHVAVLLPNGQVLAAAGWDDINGVELSSAELYDPVSGTWTNTTPMLYAADTLAGVLLTNGLVLVCGGSGNGSNFNNAVLYDPVGHTWTNTAPMNEPRSGHTATLLPDGRVLVVGGGGDTAEIYDPAARTWTLAGNTNDGRNDSLTVLLINGQVMVMGDGNVDCELYDERNNQWSYTAPMVVSGNSQTATILPDGRVVVTGGSVSPYSGPALATVQTYSANSPRVGHILVAHYPFDASSSDPFDSQFLADTSGNGNNIPGPSSLGTSLPLVSTTSIAGGTAVQFDGTGYYVLPSVLLTTIAGTYSLSLWLETTQVSGSDSDDGFADPAFVWAGGVGYPYLDSEPMTLTGGKLGFYTGGDNSTLHSATSINSGSFTHIVITRDQPSGVKKIYINGVLDSTAIAGTDFLTDSTSLELGVSEYHGGVAGIMDDVQFYNGLLTAGDVAILHAQPGATVPDLPLLSLGFALGLTNALWATSGDALWFAQNDWSRDGNGAAQSGSLADYQSSVLQTTVNGPGTLGFWWQTLCANDGFDLECDVDGTPQANLLNQNPWVHQTLAISAGTHTLSWTARSGAGSSPGDAGFLDGVTFVPLAAPTPGTWTLTGSLTNGVASHTATLLPNGKVLLAGGTDQRTSAFASAELYDPVAGNWTGISPLNQARFAHTATLLNNGLVLVAGGATDPNDDTSAIASAELFNPANRSWVATGPLHTARSRHTATLFPNGMVLVVGGLSTNPYPNITPSAEIYDPGAGLWTAVNSMVAARYGHTATLLANGRVLISGGGVTNSLLVTEGCELYDPVSGGWQATGALSWPAVNHAATLLPDGTVLVAGGDYDVGFGGGVGLVPGPFAQLYDPVSGTWSFTASLLSSRDYHTATLLPNGLVLIAGGQGYGSSSTNSAELYLPATKTWIRAGAMNAPRQYHSATLLNNGLVLAAGGRGASLLAGAELYSTSSHPPIFLMKSARLAGGAFQFAFTNTPGAAATVFGAANPGLPFANWTPLGSATESSPGYFQFTDPQTNHLLRQFYRVRSP